MYAIIATGGKQYKVSVGDVIDVEKIEAAAGDKITFDQVLAVGGDTLKVAGDVAGATVEAYPQVYPEYYPLARWWHPLAYTSLAEKGVQVTDAIQGASRWIRHAHTATDVVGNFFEAVSSLGAMVRANEKIKYALISPQGKESRSGDQTPIPTLFVDPSRKPKFNEDELVPFDTTGCSWDDPLSTIGDALEYFKLYVVDDVLNGEIVNHH